MQQEQSHMRRRWMVISGIVLGLLALAYILFVIGTLTSTETTSAWERRELARWEPQASDQYEMIDTYLADHAALREHLLELRFFIDGGLLDDFTGAGLAAGKHGELYSATLPADIDVEFLDAYVNQALANQAYCRDRGIPYRYLFLPHKAYVYASDAPDTYPRVGRHHEAIASYLQRAGVDMMDATPLLKSEADAGNRVFNKKYDVWHWNQQGAFDVMQWLLDDWKRDVPAFDADVRSKVEISTETQPFIVDTHYPIFEEVPSVQTPYEHYLKLTNSYAGLVRTYQQPNIWVMRNLDYRQGPRLLALQDSYMGIGWRYLMPAVGEYDKVHAYSNAHRMDYYVSVFQPDAVLYEQADYSSTPAFYRVSDMGAIDYNPPLAQVITHAQKVAQKDISQMIVEDIKPAQVPEAEALDASAEQNLKMIRLNITSYIPASEAREIMAYTQELQEARVQWEHDIPAFFEHRHLSPIRFRYLQQAGITPQSAAHNDEISQISAQTYLEDQGLSLEKLIDMSVEDRDVRAGYVFNRVMMPQIQALQDVLPCVYLKQESSVVDARVQPLIAEDGTLQVWAYATVDVSRVDPYDTAHISWYIANR